MKIYSMTATFGKLNHQSLTLEPGLNIIEAPNEWGKSTWCAFLVAMLYGINTREQTKTGFLADKEHYTPWSGVPMSGRMDICWNGRDITIERRNKGRGYFNEFKAYEMASGVPVEELTAANCGQTLLGVEQNVFTRAGFLRQSDLPVTADEKLRARLNALVTTGDESGTSDALAQKLKDIKNRCRFNKTGLLPQAESQRDALQSKLTQMQMLENRKETIVQRQLELKQQRQALENHKAALLYQENLAYTEKVTTAREKLSQIQQQVRLLEAACAQQEDASTAQQTLDKLRQLRDQRDALHQRARLMPSAPQQPETPAPFLGVDPETAVAQAQVSYRVFEEDSRRLSRMKIWLPLLLLIPGIVLTMMIQSLPAKIAGIALMAAAIVWASAMLADRKRRERTLHDLRRSYGNIPPEQWVAAAQRYRADKQTYTRELEAYRRDTAQLEEDMRTVNGAIATITEDRPVSEFEAALMGAQHQHSALEAARREETQAKEVVKTLENACIEVPAPTQPDTLELSMDRTEQLLHRTAVEQEQLVAQLGQCQGQLEALGQKEQLENQLKQLQQRIEKLEAVYEAVVYAMQTQEKASQELQRRFAPRISHRAQEILCKLTDGKYDRLVLDADLQISSGGAGEDTLRSNLWRSSGTADQLYLALRLAVAEELTPDAPLVLDDALVRFDETRMAAALEILKEAAQEKQVILFTCQSRETAWEKNHKGGN